MPNIENDRLRAIAEANGGVKTHLARAETRSGGGGGPRARSGRGALDRGNRAGERASTERGAARER